MRVLRWLWRSNVEALVVGILAGALLRWLAG